MWMLPLLLACTGSPEPVGTVADASRPPDIVLVAVDTLRADHLGVYGYDRDTSPNIDALAARGVRFHRAYAQSGWTLASFSSLLTGLYPHQHRVGRDSYDVARFGRLPPETTTLAEALKAKGYATHAIVNNAFVAPEFRLSQGFDVYDYKGATNDAHRSAEEAVSQTIELLRQERDEPLFVWLHLMEPHLNYDPPDSVDGHKVRDRFWTGTIPEAFGPDGRNPAGWGDVGEGRTTPVPENLRYTKARYDEEIFGLDVVMGQLVDELDKQDRWGRTMMVLTSDHGEEFWDHGAFEHGHALYGELTRVPLIVAGAGMPEGRTAGAVVEHVDLFQGLITAGGAASPSGSEGEDLFALARDRPDVSGRMAMSENVLYGPPLVSLVTDDTRLVFNQAVGRYVSFKVAPDGSELEPVAAELQGEVGNALVAQLANKRGNLDPIIAVAGPEVPSAATFQQLAALGYVDAPPAAEEEEEESESSAP